MTFPSGSRKNSARQAAPVKTRLASAAGALARDFLALLTSLRQADRDGLFPALHLAAFAALTAPQRAMLPLAHRSLDVLAGTSAIFASARLSLRHVALPPRKRGITRSTSCSIRTPDTAPGACPPAQRPRDRGSCSLPVWQPSVWRPSEVWWPRRLRPPGFCSRISGKSSDENLLVAESPSQAAAAFFPFICSIFAPESVSRASSHTLLILGKMSPSSSWMWASRLA